MFVSKCVFLCVLMSMCACVCMGVDVCHYYIAAGRPSFLGSETAVMTPVSGSMLMNCVMPMTFSNVTL